MTDPVEVLALSMFEDENGPIPPWTAAGRGAYRRDARQHIANLECAGIKLVAVYDADRHEGRWPGTTDMTDAGLAAFVRAAERHGDRESIMAAWNAMVRAAPTYGDKP